VRAYWIHYTPIGEGDPPRFWIMESDEDGRQNVLSPPGRISSPEEVVALLVSKGADPNRAAGCVAAAMRQAVANLLVKDGED